MGLFGRIVGKLTGRGREEAPEVEEAPPSAPPAPPAGEPEKPRGGRLRRLFRRKPKEAPPAEAPPAPAPPGPAPAAPEPEAEGPPAGGGPGAPAGPSLDDYDGAPDSLDVAADGTWDTSGSTWDGNINATLTGDDVKRFLLAMDTGDTNGAAQLVAVAASERDGNSFGEAFQSADVDFFYNGEF